MVVIGFFVFAIAVAAAAVLIAQNQSALVTVHGLGYSGTVHVYWVLVAGLVIAAAGLLGVAMMRAGAVHTARVRVERRGLARENARLNELATDRATVGQTMPVQHAAPVQPVAGDAAGTETRSEPYGHRHLFHRTRQV